MPVPHTVRHEVPRGTQLVDPKRIKGHNTTVGGSHGLGGATSISGEHAAMGKPQRSRESKCKLIDGAPCPDPAARTLLRM